MAAKRINKAAPLTPAEKQKRHREKKADEEKQNDDDLLSKMREVFIDDIYKLSLDEFRELIKKVYSPRTSGLVTLKELAEMVGISMYEANKLVDQGVLQPEPDNKLTDDEFAIIKFAGLTEDEFIRFLHYLGKPMTMQELSTSANIPMYKLERMDKMGLLYAA